VNYPIKGNAQCTAWVYCKMYGLSPKSKDSTLTLEIRNKICPTHRSPLYVKNK